MKVLLVSGSYPPMHCGVGDYTERLAEALSGDPEVKVSLLTSAGGGRQQPPGGPEVNRIMTAWRIGNLRSFIAAAQRIKPDIVHLQFPTLGYQVLNGPSLIPSLSRLMLHVPVVLTWHEYVPRTHFTAACYMYLMASWSNVIIAVRPDFQARIPEWMKTALGRKPIRFIPNASIVRGITLDPEERQAIRTRLGCGTSKLVVFFGFSFPHKGVDLLFRIADPRQHHLLLIGELSPQDTYHSKLIELAHSSEWRGKVTVTGYVDSTEAARYLAAADAAVFPFLEGGGIWNSSLHAAASQGTFVLTTSSERNGYDHDANIYYARLGDIAEMRRAIFDYQGTRRSLRDGAEDPWRHVAHAHKELYMSLMRNVAGRS